MESCMRLQCFAVLVALTVATFAQAQQPPRAPRGTTTTTVNGKAVTIDYGRPSLSGRTFDDLLKLLPEDRMWRLGANQVTTLTTETDLIVGGKKVPAGKYSLYVYVPESGDWQLAINKDPGMELGKLIPNVPAAAAKELWPRMDGYDKNIKQLEVARVPMKPVSGSVQTDPLTVTLSSSQNGALLMIAWGDRSWTAELNAK
jgi:hypothetical protein